MTEEQPLPTNRAMLHSELRDEIAKKVVMLTSFASSEAEMKTLIEGAMSSRLTEVEEELPDEPPEVA